MGALVVNSPCNKTSGQQKNHVGHCAACHETFAIGKSGRLEMVAVHPTAQRRGVGRALCNHVLERLESQGVLVVHIGTGGDAFHAPARGLYESLGFTELPVV